MGRLYKRVHRHESTILCSSPPRLKIDPEKCHLPKGKDSLPIVFFQGPLDVTGPKALPKATWRITCSVALISLCLLLDTCFGVAKAAKKPKRGIQNSMFEDVFVHFQPDMFMLLSPSLSYFQVLFLYFDDPKGFFSWNRTTTLCFLNMLLREERSYINPKDPCIVYLPTFIIKINQM